MIIEKRNTGEKYKIEYDKINNEYNYDFEENYIVYKLTNLQDNTQTYITQYYFVENFTDMLLSYGFEMN